MKNDDNKRSNELSFPSRKSPRADFHDYSGGDYFITICTKNKSHYFGEITNGRWQGRYHDHIIRGVQEGNRIEEYILNNVARWADDCFYSPVP